MKSLFATVALSAAALAQAHTGHGMESTTHWHATDAWGFVLLGAVLAAALWIRRGK